jgi:lysophospholipid acyltransferase (LPLAT)-like uncharacterized protein
MTTLHAGALRSGALRTSAIVRSGSALITVLFSTCRFEVTGREHYLRYWQRNQPVIFVLWHGRLLAGAYEQRGNGLVALISQHRDGEYIARIIERWGYRTVRGSSTRGAGRALRGLLRETRAGRTVVLTPDGPQGPRERLKPGALLVAQLSGAPLVPAATGASRAWWVENWDRFQIPKPFSRVRVAYGEPLHVPREIDEATLPAYAAELEARLKSLMRHVDRGG